MRPWLAILFLALLAADAAAQQPIWAGASRIRCEIERASTCDMAKCAPMTVMRFVVFDLAGNRTCGSRDGANCAAQWYDLTVGDRLGRKLFVVGGTGTSYSVAPDGGMVGTNVLAPRVITYYGRCTGGDS